ncbi:sensor histidine kinase [Rhizosphaericola mali]|nr:histidine kinase [Rhizosphaericola mali]
MRKNKISIFMPISIAILLPGINFLSHNTDWPILSYNSFMRWGWSSIILYILWYALLWTNKINSNVKKLFATIVIIIFSIIIFIFCTLLVFQISNVVKYQLIIKIAFASILFLVIQYALRANQNIGILQTEKEKALTEVYKMQLQELRTRIDPHFLFNSLNTLRSMIRQKDQNAESFILDLSNIYRQILSIKDQSSTTLKKEFEVVYSYIQLMQERNKNGVFVKINLDDQWMDYKLPTLSVQTIIENCFKHNRISSKDPLFININTDVNGILTITNNVLPKISIEEKSGMGLQNINKSYQLLHIKEGLIYEKNETNFIVHLKLIKNEHINN